MITEIWVDGQQLDLYSDTNIKHTLQVNDIADLKDRQANYTNAFSIPKTPNNIQIFGGLGIPSDTSRMPYLKPDCKMKIEGFDFIVKGWMNVTETDENYRIYVYSGIINFFKAIENKTLGNDLDLSEINHTKDLASVVNSYLPNSPYRYFIADYNGQTHFLNDPSIINIDYLVPSVRIKYLWEKLHSTFNFPFEGDVFDSEDFNSLWITYPKAPNISELFKLISSGHNVQRINFPQAQGESIATNHRRLFVNNIDPGSTVWRNGQYLDIVEDGLYRIYFEAITIGSGGAVWPNINYWLGINSEGIEPQNITNKKLLVNTTDSAPTSKTIFLPLTAGSVLQIFFQKPFWGGPPYMDADFTIKLEKINKETVDFQDGLEDFSIKDFVKEVMNVFSLTMFQYEHSKMLTYKTIAERVKADVVDWSGKFIERTGEEYIVTNYAQRNFFQYQYNDKEGSYKDGYIDLSNLNIDATKVILKSKTYAPERIKTKFKIDSTTEVDSDVFKFYDKQPNDNPNNPPAYKGLEKRFYFIHQADGTYFVKMGSAATNETQTVSNAVRGNFTGLDWQNILGKYYGDYTTIISDSRLHTISLDISFIDLIQIDFQKLYYFEQEQQYYILNKLNFDEKKATGEFIRVKRITDSELISIGASIAWIDGNIGSTSTWSHYEAVATIIGNPTYVWQTRFNNGPWVDVAPNVLNYDYQFQFGVNELRISYTNGAVSGFSNILTYERKVEVDPNKCYRFDFTSLQALPRTIEYVNLVGQTTSIVLNFSNATEIKSVEAKSIISMGGATLVNQVIIPCPPVVCIIYRAVKFAGSGDDLWVDYIDCNGNPQYETQYGFGTGQWLEYNRCAREGTFNTNGIISEEGSC
jgi:hypothetical protein